MFLSQQFLYVKKIIKNKVKGFQKKWSLKRNIPLSTGPLRGKNEVKGFQKKWSLKRNDP